MTTVSGKYIHESEKRWLNFVVKKHKKLAKRLGLTKDAKKLGSGAYGVVFTTTDPTRVIKLTGCRSEYEKVSQIIDKPVDNVVRYYKAYKLEYNDLWDGDHLYVFVMERLYPLPDWAFSALYTYGSPGSRSYEQRALRWVPKTPEVRKFIQHIDRGWLKLLSIGVRHTDVHGNNIMMSKDGEFKLVDVM